MTRVAPSFNLTGKTVLITGAARGIGFETARQAYAHGASLILVDLDRAEAERAAGELGPAAIGIGADVRDLAAMEAAVAAGVEQFGAVDVVIANAGITPPKTTARAIDNAVWEKVIEVNLLGVWRTIRAGLPQIKANRGQVVLIASSYSHVNGIFNSSYAVSKAAVEALGRALQAELAPCGASATVAYFGFVETGIISEIFDKPAVDRFRKEMVPSFLTRPIKAETAAAGLIEGMQTRAPRVIRPGIWKLPFYLRGLVGPLSDRRLERDSRMPGFVGQIEAQNAGPDEDLAPPPIARPALVRDFDLKGKVVIVTGAARGIGFEIARESHRKGASVVLIDLDLAQTEAAAGKIGSNALALAADVTSAEAVRLAFDQARRYCGRIDVVVANAGIAPSISTAATLPVEDWEKVIEVNLFGVWRTVRAALPDVIGNRGQILVVSSSYAFTNGVFSSPYAVAKAGVEALGRALRPELVPFGASATTLYFGWIKTEMVRNAFADPTANRLRTEVFPKFLTRQVSARRAGRKVVKAMGRRAPRLIFPFEWRLLFALRGLIGPVSDRMLAGDGTVAELTRVLESGQSSEDRAR